MRKGEREREDKRERKTLFGLLYVSHLSYSMKKLLQSVENNKPARKRERERERERERDGESFGGSVQIPISNFIFPFKNIFLL